VFRSVCSHKSEAAPNLCRILYGHWTSLEGT